MGRIASSVDTTPPLDGDAELMLRVRAGDIASFTTLWDKHHPAIVRFTYRKVRNFALAEELSQEVFLRAYRSRHSYRATAKFRTWLFRIATNLALNAIRDAMPETLQRPLHEGPGLAPVLRLRDAKPTAEDTLVREVELNEIRRAIADLPDLQRTAVRMQRYREMDYSQIARSLNCSESAVKSLLFRAHEALRHRLAPVSEPQSDLLTKLAS